jgi:pimeloyl-ACP methyl ester carboxylesterase
VLLLRDSLAAFAVDSVAGVGHFPFEERPSAVVDAVRRLDAGLRLALGGASQP